MITCCMQFVRKNIGNLCFCGRGGGENTGVHSGKKFGNKYSKQLPERILFNIVGWLLRNARKRKSFILNKHLSAHTICLVFCSKVLVATYFGSTCVKLRQLWVTKVLFIACYYLLTFKGLRNGQCSGRLAKPSERVKQCLVRPRVPTSPPGTLQASGVTGSYEREHPNEHCHRLAVWTSPQTGK